MKTCYFNEFIPDEIISTILSFVSDTKDYFAVSLTCTKLKRLLYTTHPRAFYTMCNHSMLLYKHMIRKQKKGELSAFFHSEKLSWNLKRVDSKKKYKWVLDLENELVEIPQEDFYEISKLKRTSDVLNNPNTRKEYFVSLLGSGLKEVEPHHMCNKNLTCVEMVEYANLATVDYIVECFDYITERDDLTMEAVWLIDEYKSGCEYSISMNNCLTTVEVVKANPDYNWCYNGIVHNKNFTFEDYFEVMFVFAKAPELDEEYVEKWKKTGVMDRAHFFQAIKRYIPVIPMYLFREFSQNIYDDEIIHANTLEDVNYIVETVVKKPRNRLSILYNYDPTKEKLSKECINHLDWEYISENATLDIVKLTIGTELFKKWDLYSLEINPKVFSWEIINDKNHDLYHSWSSGSGLSCSKNPNIVKSWKNVANVLDNDNTEVFWYIPYVIATLDSLGEEHTTDIFYSGNFKTTFSLHRMY